MELLLFVFVVAIISIFAITVRDLCQCSKDRKELLGIEKEAKGVHNAFSAGRI